MAYYATFDEMVEEAESKIEDYLIELDELLDKRDYYLQINEPIETINKKIKKLNEIISDLEKESNQDYFEYQSEIRATIADEEGYC